MTSYRVRRHNLRHQDRDRTFTTVLPAELPAGAPVLLYLHGSRQSASVSRNFTAHTFDDLAETTGTVVVYPEGVERHFNDARAGLREATRTLGIDDVGFLRKIIGHLATAHDVDRSRVYAVGYSNGGQMVIRLLHDAPELIAGAATIAAPVPVPGNFSPDSRDATVVARPVLVMHGTGDPIVPYQGGAAGTPATGVRGHVRSAPESAAYHARRNGITTAPVRSHPTEGVTVSAWRQPGRAEVQLWSLKRGRPRGPRPEEAAREPGSRHRPTGRGAGDRRILRLASRGPAFP